MWLWKTNKINIELLWHPPNKSLQIKTVILHNALEHERKGDGNRKETNKHQIIKTRYKKNYVNINKNKYQKAVKEIKMRWCVFKLDFRLSLSIFLYVFCVVPWPKYLSSYIIYKHKCGIVCSEYNRITFIVSQRLSKWLDNAFYC